MKETRKQILEELKQELIERYQGDIIKEENGYYNYFEYIIYNQNIIVYIQVNDNLSYSIYTAYNFGVSQQQKTYFEECWTREDVFNHIERSLNNLKESPKKQNKDRLAWDLYTIRENGQTELDYMKAMFGYREKEIFKNLFYIKITKYEGKEIINFYDKELNYFQYSCYHHEITN